MASQFGFVYLLGHPQMPNVFKIGFTDRAPHLRAQELSNSTSVPAPFHVICYFEAEDAMEIERSLHRIWVNFRVSPNREFFEIEDDGWHELAGHFRWHPKSLAFTDVALHYLDVYSADSLPNPWAPSEPQPAPAEPELKVVGGTDAQEPGQCQAA